MSVFFYVCVHHRDLHSFPTRRSSDLGVGGYGVALAATKGAEELAALPGVALRGRLRPVHVEELLGDVLRLRTGRGRSEEHTSELQSLRHLVCRLLLEKKNKMNNNNPI